MLHGQKLDLWLLTNHRGDLKKDIHKIAVWKPIPSEELFGSKNEN